MAFAGVEAETLAAAKQPAYRWRCYPLLLQTLHARTHARTLVRCNQLIQKLSNMLAKNHTSALSIQA